jgi:hypothetical protein
LTLLTTSSDFEIDISTRLSYVLSKLVVKRDEEINENQKDPGFALQALIPKVADWL